MVLAFVVSFGLLPMGLGVYAIVMQRREARTFEPCPACGKRALKAGGTGTSVCQQCHASFPTMPNARLLR